MTRTGFRSFIFSPILYNVLHMTSREQQKDDAHRNESVTTQLASESASALCTQKSQPAAVVTHREQQEATTHCGSEFENQIL